MHIHILGICGTFMGSLAIIAKEMGFQVTGSDHSVYPPMSTQLERAGIILNEGYEETHLRSKPDLVVVGNALKRGMPIIEYMLNQGMYFTSGPQFLSDIILKDKWVLAVSGTHGKTTTSSMLAWILEFSKMSPSFLIGGAANNFDFSAQLGDSPFFVIEADEYDSAFFDKRSKFIHYRPKTLIINNLEFDHADIFHDLQSMQTQFHHLVRIVPGIGKIIVPENEKSIEEVLQRGCWSELEYIGGKEWNAQKVHNDGSSFEILHKGKKKGSIHWQETGDHNMSNALAAIVAAVHVGVPSKLACEALCAFKGVKRRMEQYTEVNGIFLYDDFAHHPTAIATTLAGLRARVGKERIIAIIEPRSNTMKMGVHKDTLGAAIVDATEVIWFRTDGLEWRLDSLCENTLSVPSKIMNTVDAIVEYIVKTALPNDNVVVMSNGGFDNICERLKRSLVEKYTLKTIID